MTGRDPLLLEIAAAIGAGRIRFGSMQSEGAFIHGHTADDGAITINPVPDVVDTALHEAIHRLRPAWSERTVKRTTTKIMRQLSDKEIDKLFELVCVSAKAHRVSDSVL